MGLIKQKQKYNQLEIRERNKEINEKFNSIDQKIAVNNERKRLHSLKHREMDNLRFSDFEELRNNHKNKGFKEKCDIIEKHIGMSISLTEKK